MFSTVHPFRFRSASTAAGSANCAEARARACSPTASTTMPSKYGKVCSHVPMVVLHRHCCLSMVLRNGGAVPSLLLLGACVDWVCCAHALQEFAVPKEFPSVLKAFSREILRAQPDNIYEFGASHFTAMQEQAEAALAAETGGIRRLTKAELEELLSSMFMEADTDNSGALSLQEFKVCAAIATGSMLAAMPAQLIRLPCSWRLTTTLPRTLHTISTLYCCDRRLCSRWQTLACLIRRSST